MNRYQDIVGRIQYGLFLTVVALLPFPQIALRYVSVTWFVFWLLEGRWMRKPNVRRTIYDLRFTIPFLVFGLWFVWKAVSGLWAADSAAWARQIERYLTFAVLVPVGIWGLNERYDWKLAGKVLAWSCVAAVPVYLGLMTVLFYHRDWTALLPLSVDWDNTIPDWLTFVADNISHIKHRLYLSSVALLGAVMAVQVWRERRWRLVWTLPVMLSIIPLTGSRQAIITGVVMLVIGIIYALPQRYRLRYGLCMLALGALLSGAVLKFHPRTEYVNMEAVKQMREVSYYHDIRLNIWGFGLQQPSDYLLYGLGAGQCTDYLRERYREAGFDYYYERGYNAHCQYLEELIELGVAGLLLFLLAWCSVPLCTNKKGRLTAVLFTTLFMLNMCTECMFGRYDGVALWTMGMLLIFLQTHAEGEQ